MCLPSKLRMQARSPSRSSAAASTGRGLASPTAKRGSLEERIRPSLPTRMVKAPGSAAPSSSVGRESARIAANCGVESKTMAMPPSARPPTGLWTAAV